MEYTELVNDLRENHDKYLARDMQAADAIEYLVRKLESREAALAYLVGCLWDSTNATTDVLDTTEDRIT